MSKISILKNEIDQFTGDRFHLSQKELKKNIDLFCKAKEILRVSAHSQRGEMLDLAGRLTRESKQSRLEKLFHRIFHRQTFKEWKRQRSELKKTRKELAEEEEQIAKLEEFNIDPSDFEDYKDLFFGHQNFYEWMRAFNMKPSDSEKWPIPIFQELALAQYKDDFEQLQKLPAEIIVRNTTEGVREEKISINQLTKEKFEEYTKPGKIEYCTVRNALSIPSKEFVWKTTRESHDQFLSGKSALIRGVGYVASSRQTKHIIHPFAFLENPPEQPKMELIFCTPKNAASGEENRSISVQVTDTNGAVYRLGIDRDHGNFISPDPSIIYSDEDFNKEVLAYNLGDKALHPVMNWIEGRRLNLTEENHLFQLNGDHVGHQLLRIACKYGASVQNSSDQSEFIQNFNADATISMAEFIDQLKKYLKQGGVLTESKIERGIYFRKQVIVNMLRSDWTTEERAQIWDLVKDLRKKINLSGVTKQLHRWIHGQKYQRWQKTIAALDNMCERIEQIEKLGIKPENLEECLSILNKRGGMLFRKLQSEKVKFDGRFALPCYEENLLLDTSEYEELTSNNAELIVRGFDGVVQEKVRVANLTREEFGKYLNPENNEMQQVFYRMPVVMDGETKLNVPDMVSYEFAIKNEEEFTYLADFVRYEDGALLDMPEGYATSFNLVEMARTISNQSTPLSEERWREALFLFEDAVHLLQRGKFRVMRSEMFLNVHQAAEKIKEKIQSSFPLKLRREFEIGIKDALNAYASYEKNLGRLRELGVDPSLSPESLELFLKNPQLYYRIKGLGTNCVRDGRFGFSCYCETMFDEYLKEEAFLRCQELGAQLILINEKEGFRTELLDFKQMDYDRFMSLIDKEKFKSKQYLIRVPDQEEEFYELTDQRLQEFFRGDVFNFQLAEGVILKKEGLIYREPHSFPFRVEPYQYVDTPPKQPKLELIFHKSPTDHINQHISIKITDKNGAVYSVGVFGKNFDSQGSRGYTFEEGHLEAPDHYLFLPEKSSEQFSLEYNLGDQVLHPLMNWIEQHWIGEDQRVPQFHPLRQNCAFFGKEVVRVALEHGAQRSFAVKPLKGRNQAALRIMNAAAPIFTGTFPFRKKFNYDPDEKGLSLEGRNIRRLSQGKILLPSMLFLREQSKMSKKRPVELPDI